MSKSITLPSSPIFYLYLTCSKLSHFEYCPKRSKIETFIKSKGNTSLEEEGSSNTFTVRGTKLHLLYSYPNKGFDRLRLKLRLLLYANVHNGIRRFRKQVPNTNIIVIGMYDDLRVIRDVGTNKKYTILVEVKTTSKKYIPRKDIKMAVRQLQLYMWLLKEILELLGCPLWKRSYVEFYSQKGGQLIKSISVEYCENIEEWIRYVVDCYMGIKPVCIPPYSLCKRCPINVKWYCDWYKMRKEYYEGKYNV